MKRKILLGLMVSLSVALHADQQSDARLWIRVFDVTGDITNDAEVQRAVIKVGVEIHNMITVIAKKYAKQLSPAEKKLVLNLLKHLNGMMQKAKMLMASGGQDVNAQQELQQMIEQLRDMVTPAIIAMQAKAAEGDPLKIGQKRLMFTLELIQGLLQTMIAPLQ